MTVALRLKQVSEVKDCQIPLNICQPQVPWKTTRCSISNAQKAFVRKNQVHVHGDSDLAVKMRDHQNTLCIEMVESMNGRMVQVLSTKLINADTEGLVRAIIVIRIEQLPKGESDENQQRKQEDRFFLSLYHRRI